MNMVPSANACGAFRTVSGRSWLVSPRIPISEVSEGVRVLRTVISNGIPFFRYHARLMPFKTHLLHDQPNCSEL